MVVIWNNLHLRSGLKFEIPAFFFSADNRSQFGLRKKLEKATLFKAEYNLVKLGYSD